MFGIQEVKDTSSSFWNWESWKGQLIYRTTTRKTTWKFRLLVVALLLVLSAATHRWWVPALGWGLVSDSRIEKPDLILIDNLDPNYLLFEKAGDMKRRGLNTYVLVPVSASGQDPERPGLVARKIVEAMIEVAHLDWVELLHIQATEPTTRAEPSCKSSRFGQCKNSLEQAQGVGNNHRQRCKWKARCWGIPQPLLPGESIQR